MPNRYAILAVEGAHDQVFVAELLVRHGFTKFDGTQSNLDGFWTHFTPAWPKNGRLYSRPDMPTIVHRNGISILICTGEGTSLLTKFPDTFANRPQYKTNIAAFGIVVDADTKACPEVAKSYADAYRTHFNSFPDLPGVIDKTGIHTGIFVLPDNHSTGTLEDILLECGAVGYPDLTAKARSFVSAIDRSALTADDKKGLLKFAGENKALVASISGVLKPGMVLEHSIRNDRWLEAGSLALPRVDALTKFLRELIAF